MKNSHIEWTDHTFNPWIGCTKVSPGCAHCYAETRDQRFAKGIHWGKSAPRQRTSVSNWRQPVAWNAHVDYALKNGEINNRPRVFCASLADWLDDEVPIEWLADLLKLIHDTPNLDWLLLTKRPQNWAKRIDAAMSVMSTWDNLEPGGMLVKWYASQPPENIWIGTTVEDQQRADERIPALLDIPAKVRFLSCEPQLGAVTLWTFDQECQAWRGPGVRISGGMTASTPNDVAEGYDDSYPDIDWVICGGESGPGARPMHPDWARGLRDQCSAANVPFFFKQWGEWFPLASDRLVGFDDNIDFVLPDASAINREAFVPENAQAMIRDGKRLAGRLLDGRVWNEFPKAEVPA